MGILLPLAIVLVLIYANNAIQKSKQKEKAKPVRPPVPNREQEQQREMRQKIAPILKPAQPTKQEPRQKQAPRVAPARPSVTTQPQTLWADDVLPVRGDLLEEGIILSEILGKPKGLQ